MQKVIAYFSEETQITYRSKMASTAFIAWARDGEDMMGSYLLFDDPQEVDEKSGMNRESNLSEPSNHNAIVIQEKK